MFVVPFDIERLTTTAEPVQLGDGSSEFAVSNEGTLVYGTGLAAGGRELVWVDRRGREEPVGAPTADYAYPRLSPDGTRIALDVPGPNRDIWMWDIKRRVLERFTNDPTENALPAWTPKGDHLAFASGLSGVPNMFLQPTNGAGKARLLFRSPRLQQAVSFAPDGRLVFTESVPGRSRDIKVMDLATKAVTSLVETEANELSAVVSSDGRWIAYMSDESGQFEIYVRPFPDVDRARWKVSANGGRSPLFAKNGRELFYQDFGGAIMGVPIGDARAFAPGAAAPIIPAGRKYAGFGSAVGGRPFDVSADGSRFLMIKLPSAGNAPAFVVVQNWLAEVANRLRPRPHEPPAVPGRRLVAERR